MGGDKQDKLGMRLLKKGHKGILRLVFSRTAVITLLFLTNFTLLFLFLFRFSTLWPEYYGFNALFTVIMALYLFNSRLDPSAKLTWLVLITTMPIFGTLFYLFTLVDLGHNAMGKRCRQIKVETADALIQEPAVIHNLKVDSPETLTLSNYLNRTGCYPVYGNTDVEYFPSGEAKFDALLRELEKAEHFKYYPQICV